MVSLWLVPGPQDAESFKTIMLPRHDTKDLLSKYSYPAFEPHVTLASIPPRDLSDIRNALPLPTGPLSIPFASLETGDHYFRSVYVAIKPTPELLALHKTFHENIDVSPKTPSFPHCSVCYIADEDAETGERGRFSEGLRATGRVRDREDGTGVSLQCGAGSGQLWMSGWEVKEIWIVQCQGPVGEWHVLDKISIDSK